MSDFFESLKQSTRASRDVVTRTRGFELISTETNQELLPKRETAHAAGYDLKASKEITIEPGQIELVPTGVKAYMLPDEVLYLFDRSSNPRKRGLILINSVGVIDHDYYNNPSNEGLIMAQFKNITDEPVTIHKGDRIVQGVFAKYFVTDDDNANGERTGGFGSTGNQKGIAMDDNQNRENLTTDELFGPDWRDELDQIEDDWV